MRRIKILIVAHSAVLYSGNAEVVRNIFLPIVAQFWENYEVKQIGLVHISAVREVPWEIIPTRVEYTRAGARLLAEDYFGELTLDRILSDWGPDLVFLHNDPEPCLRQLVRVGNRSRTIAYISIDGTPLPSSVSKLLGMGVLVTMSNFSRSSMIDRVGILGTHILVMSASVDIDRFAPVSREQRERLREQLAPRIISNNTMVLGWVGRNQWRKQMWINYHLLSLIKSGNYRICEVCRASAPLEAPYRYCRKCGSSKYSNPEPLSNIVLWIHIPTGEAESGWNLSELEQYYSLKRGQDVVYTEGCSPNTHLSTEDMPRLLQMWDLLLFLSGGEGFGMPALEAMSCGLPIVYSSYSSHSEWIGKANAGISVSGILQPEFGNPMMRMIADVYAALDAVLALKHNRDLVEFYGRNGREFAESVSTTRMGEKWHHLFQSVLYDSIYSA